MSSAPVPTGHNPRFVQIERVDRRFVGTHAVKAFDLDIAEGEFVSLLGPSGCGKTTLLRMIAGLDFPDEGRILVDGRDVTWLPPNKRPVNLVFQRVTLFPHLNVFDNVAFGLRLRRLPRATIAEMVGRYLDLVRLPEFASRDVATLSGGQAQRIALARALVNQPKVLLLDEPLAALDLKVRREIQVELKEIHRALGVTFVYVTHDQEEAMRMSDRIVVMDEGRIVQAGSPLDIYSRPASVFAAGFVGSSNLWRCAVNAADGDGRVVLDLTGRLLEAETTTSLRPGQEAWLLLRPEALSVQRVGDAAAPVAGRSLRGTITDVSFLGAATHYRIESAGETVLASRPPGDGELLAVGDEVYVTWPANAALALAC